MSEQAATMNRAQRRQAAKEFQAQLAAGGIDLSQRAAEPKKVFTAYVAGPTVSTAWHRALIAAAQKSTQFGFAIRLRDCEILKPSQTIHAKNLLLKSFLETEDDYLLFVDTDIAFAPQDVAMLLAVDAAIAGALYFSAATGVEPQPQAWVEGDEGYDPVALPKPPEDFDETDQEALESWMATLSLPIPVAGVGFGLVLIKREVAELMAQHLERPFGLEGEADEDLTFCLRAKELGFETQLLPAARVGHMQLGMQ